MKTSTRNTLITATATLIVGFFGGKSIEHLTNNQAVNIINNIKLMSENIKNFVPQSGDKNINQTYDFQIENINLQNNYNELNERYNNIKNEYDNLREQYNELLENSESLKLKEEEKENIINFGDLIYKSQEFKYSTGININGNSYSGFELFDIGAYAIANLEKKYVQLSFDFGALDKGCDLEQVGNIHIILDGVEKEVCTVKADELMKHFDIDISNVSQIKLELHCNEKNLFADGFGIVNINLR